MFHKIIKVEPLKKQILKIYFENGEIKYYDMNKAIKEIEALEPLKDEKIFKKAFVDSGGYAIVWDNVMDIAGEELYINSVDDINQIQNE